MPDSERVLGIDPGDRRVGIAISDALGVTAQGLDTFDRNTGDLLGHIGSLIDRYNVTRVVVGHPVSMSGRPSESSRKAQALARDIEDKHGVAVTMWDERLSSVEAQRVLKGARAPKGSVDRVAAVLILQTYLDSLAS